MNGELVKYVKGKEPVRTTFEKAANPFEIQAKLFIQEIHKKEGKLLNTPQISIEDVVTVSAILESIDQNETIHFN